MTTIERIDFILEERNIVPAQMMKAIGASTGLFSQWRSGLQKPSADKVVKIADYLNCSVDYLLGRTDNPEMYATITTGNIIGDNNANINIDSQDEKIMAEFYKIISRMDFREQNNLMNVIYDYIDSKTKK